MKNILSMIIVLVVLSVTFSASVFAAETPAKPGTSTEKTVSEKAEKPSTTKKPKKSKKVKPEKTEEEAEEEAEEAEELLTPEAKVTLGLTYGVTNFFTAWISALIVMIGGAGARCLFGTIGDIVVWIVQFGMIGGLVLVTPNPDPTVYALGVFGAILGAGLGIFQGWCKTVTVA